MPSGLKCLPSHHQSQVLALTRGSAAQSGPKPGALPPSRWHCLSRESLPQSRGQWPGGSGSRSESLPGSRATGGAETGGPAGRQQCVSAGTGRGAWQPLRGLKSALTSLLAPILGPGEMLTLQRQRASFPEGLVRVSSSLFSFNRSFPKRNGLSCKHSSARARVDDGIINAMLTRAEY